MFWRHGDIEGIYIDSTDNASSANLKRGLASLFQYRTLDDEVRQRDASGICDVAYVSTGENTIKKTKTACTHDTLPPPRRHPNPVFAVKLESYRNSEYLLTQSLLPEQVIDFEGHKITLASKLDIGANVLSERTLKQAPEILSANIVQADSAKHAVMILEPGYRESGIELQPEPVTCPNTGCPTVKLYSSKYPLLSSDKIRKDRVRLHILTLVIYIVIFKMLSFFSVSFRYYKKFIYIVF